MIPDTGKYYPYPIRWQERVGFLLWVECPEIELLWTDAQNKVPIFRTSQQLDSFALSLARQLQKQSMPPTHLDSVAAWVAGGADRPVGECLRAWHLFADLSAGVQKPFIGNEHNAERDPVFDLLYAESGPYLESDTELPWRIKGPVVWQPQELNTLRLILTQGLGLWQQSTYWYRAA